MLPGADGAPDEAGAVVAPEQWRVTSGEKRDIVPGHGAILILAFFTRNLLLATRND